MAKKPRRKKVGIFCLETAAWDEKTWDKKATHHDSFSQDSYDHFLRFLETSITDTGGIPYRHFDVATKEEFEFYLKKWKQENIQKHFPVLLLAFHGDREGFGVIKDKETFVADQLAEYLREEWDDAYDNAIIHFSSCYFTENAKMEKLLYETSALAVSGYMNKAGVGWYEATAFELLYLTKLFSAGLPKTASEMQKIGKCFADKDEAGNENKGGMKALSDSLQFNMWYRVDKVGPNTYSNPPNVHAVSRRDLIKTYGPS